MSATVVVVGVSHTRTPATLRERVHLALDRAAELASLLAGGEREAVVLTTCNRTELYLTGTDCVVEQQRAMLALAELGDGSDVASTAYVHAEGHAARHLFRVAAGLDAIVVGDTHVAAQVRQAHHAARAAGATGPLLDRLFEAAAVASKRIRSETSVSSGPTSIPAAAIAAAARIVGPLSERRLLVIGAGTIAKLSAQKAASRGCREIVVANHNLAHASELAGQVGGRATTFTALDAEIAAADIVVSATAAAGFILTAEHAVTLARRDRRPLVVFDLALPRDVDPVWRESRRLRLLDLDDLARIVAVNRAGRRADLERAEDIARDEAGRYETWRRSRAATPAIVALRADAERARRTVLARHTAALARLAPPERGLVEKITLQLVAKLLHGPTLELRRLPSSRLVPSPRDPWSRQWSTHKPSLVEHTSLTEASETRW